jgi:putative Mg2+ transporter-C (MgtC) family protein
MMTMQWWDIAPLGWENILVCLVCGTLVGLERQLRGQTGGDPHLFLIVLGTYCFLAIGAAVSPQGADQARVLGQLITGVGFLGAGVMMTRDGQVLG